VIRSMPSSSASSPTSGQRWSQNLISHRFTAQATNTAAAD
jgi:hypothetical protein